MLPCRTRGNRGAVRTVFQVQRSAAAWFVGIAPCWGKSLAKHIPFGDRLLSIRITLRHKLFYPIFRFSYGATRGTRSTDVLMLRWHNAVIWRAQGSNKRQLRVAHPGSGKLARGDAANTIFWPRKSG